jgi:hypothetical protein
MPQSEQSSDPRYNGPIVSAFRSAVAKCNINAIPKIVAELLDTEAWRIFLVSAQLHQNTDFLAFITGPPHQGCAWDPGMVEALLQKSGDQITLMRWRQAITAPPGGDQKSEGARSRQVEAKVEAINSDIITIDPKRGTSLAYTLDRLSRERPDLLAKVAAKEMSANAAAIEAGFRKKPTPFESTIARLPKFSREERRKIHMLTQDCPECGASMNHQTYHSAETGKEWNGWECDSCGNSLTVSTRCRRFGSNAT